MKKMKILMAAAEIAPFAKVGGLADVLESLPPALQKRFPLEVRLVMPKYGSLKATGLKEKKRFTYLGKEVVLWEGQTKGKIKIYFLENKEFFGRPEVYWGNNEERFAFFSGAILTALPLIKFLPDVIHCHDYHTALLIPLGKKVLPQKVGTMLTIHNLRYQGKTKTAVIKNQFPEAWQKFSFWPNSQQINFLRLAIQEADYVTTVSPTYAREITRPAYGEGLEKELRRKGKNLVGILNGLDTDLFNPQKDKNIFCRYSATSLAKKKKNKLALQKELGLPEQEDILLVGLVSRLVFQKGIDFVPENLGDLKAQFVFLGTGEKKYEDYLKSLEKKYPQQVRAKIMFDLKLASQIYAASDLFLMPSRFEPCGLGQMIAMRYGAVPLVRKTGGLADTVRPYAPRARKATGFVFTRQTQPACYNALKRASRLFYCQPKIWQNLQKNGLQQDFSWHSSAQEYFSLYQKLRKK